MITIHQFSTSNSFLLQNAETGSHKHYPLLSSNKKTKLGDSKKTFVAFLILNDCLNIVGGIRVNVGTLIQGCH